MKDYPLSFDDFSKYLSIVEKDVSFHDSLYKLSNNFSEEIIQDFTFDYPDLGVYIIELLEKVFKDESQWISYWCYELDFGRQYEENIIQDEYGKDIPLKTKEDLWNIIVGNYEADSEVDKKNED